MKQSFIKENGEYKGVGENYQFDEFKYNSTTGQHELTKDQQIIALFENGNLIKEKLKTGKSVSYEYMNNLLEKITEDKSGNFIDIVYITVTDKTDKILDNMNREVSFTYDSTNCLETITYADGVVSTFDYNTDNQLLSEVISKPTEQYTLFSNTYDTLGRLKTIDDNNANQLETVTDWNRNVTIYAYYANGTVESYNYYKNNWLKSKIDKDSSNNIISEFNFTYDNVGNITTENGNNKNVTNVYSDLYELEQQVKKDDSQVLLLQDTYTYDSEGNILTRNDENGVVDTMTYIDGNVLSTYNTSSVVYDDRST